MSNRSLSRPRCFTLLWASLATVCWASLIGCSRTPAEPGGMDQAGAAAPAAGAEIVPAPAEVQSERDGGQFRWSGTVSADAVIDIRGISGSIKVEAADGDEAVVVASKSGRGADAVRIERVQTGRGLMFCAVYPGGSCGEDSDLGDSSDFGDGGEVKFWVKLPRGVGFGGHTINGSVSATGLGGPAELTTINGSIKAEAATHLRATTVNGPVAATLVGEGRLDVAIESVNGPIDVRLPAGANATVSATTLNGGVQSDFPLSHDRGEFVGENAHGKLGSGEGRLELETVNGGIRLTRLQRA